MMATKQGGKVRVGIAGLDHWYIGLDAARAAAAHPAVDLVVVAHHDLARAQETAQRCGAAEATTDYQSVVRRDDLDVVVTACPTAENAALCIEAAQHGTHILSVKPIAMTREQAARVKEAVVRAGIHFMSWESHYRLDRRYQQIKAWIAEGRIGRPVSGLYVLRCGTPTQPWPGVQGPTWWLDPAQAPGGGWLDHAIYAIDTFRWLFGGEVVSVGGLAATLVHTELAPSFEDFGLATLAFTQGQIASVEVTWTGAPGSFYTATQVVGSEGAIALDSLAPGRATISGHYEPFSGWSSVTLPQNESNPLGSLVAAIQEGSALPAGADDACRNLDVCLTFYEAAREGSARRAVTGQAS